MNPYLPGLSIPDSQHNMTESWAADVRGDKWLQGLEEQQAIGIVQQLLENKTDPGGAAHAIGLTYEAGIKSGER